MAESIILPDTSLLLVHKGWSLAGKNNTESISLNVKSRGLEAGAREKKMLPSSTQAPINFEFVNVIASLGHHAPARLREENQATREVREKPAGMQKKRCNVISPGLTNGSRSKLIEEKRSHQIARARPIQVQRLPLVCPGSASAFYGGGFPFEMNVQVSTLINVFKSHSYPKVSWHIMNYFRSAGNRFLSLPFECASCL
jgi:hypothetical protein